MDIKERIREASMSPRQWGVIALCLLLVMIDGFDIAVISLTSPQIQDDWGVGQSMIGYLLSSGLLGMAIGSILLSPLADRIGRRKLLLTGLLMSTAGMFLSGFTTSAGQLLACRLLTGLGIGCMIAIIGVLLNEFSSRKRYGLIMGVYAAGISLGATLGGAASGPLLDAYGWQAAFIMGGVISAVLLVACWIVLPESVDYLVDRGDLGGLNRVLRRIRQEPLDELPARAVPKQETGKLDALKTVFGRRMLASTMLLMGGYGALVVSFYFLANWNPVLLSESTGDEDIGVMATVLWNFGGMGGCLAFGLLGAWFKPRPVTVLFMAAAAAATLVYGSVLGSAGSALAVMLAVGFVTNAGIAGFYSIIPPLFPSTVRATGFGTIIGAGRLLAVVAPSLGGMLLDSGWSPGQTVTLFAAPLALSALLCWILDRSTKKRPRAPAQTEPTGSAPSSPSVHKA